MEELPPVVPTIRTIIETAYSHPEDLSIFSLESNLDTIEFPRDSVHLRQMHVPQLPYSIKINRDTSTGRRLHSTLLESSIYQETSKTSHSFSRAPSGSRGEGVKGNSNNLPFSPGGVLGERKKSLLGSNKRSGGIVDIEGKEEEEIFRELFDTNRLKCLPTHPHLEVDFEKENKNNLDKDNKDVKPFKADDGKPFDFWQGLHKPESKNEDWRAVNKEARRERGVNQLMRELAQNPKPDLDEEEEERKEAKVLRISNAPSVSRIGKLEWAEAIDVSAPMHDFHERVPDLAFKYPFELDVFQKQAIVCLEEHENVFVAAHTSAGKTVVAEYAIALSVRHLTRVIYTSPIKALSNQKFRDFKTSFESVGLVTGDVQINQGASCLIMTTEILRSMLYNGSDVIRDLEWVIFDEIHYLNNAERGHVWEEVLIMLPQHVSIIMLSATVPNALAFADWVGEIKRKKIFVISTPKRPVPLEHFLYTGSGGKSKKEQHLILGADGKFFNKGYSEAVASVEDRKSKHAKTFGPKNGAQRLGWNEKSEKNTYIGLIDHLKTTDKLPVVIFTFSRNRCDSYAQMLESVDLCTGAQKGEIHGFFQKSISKLTGTDRMLPQVLAFEKMLKNGIGVHHSGILPILKEVVEMLFQKGLVKLLFATETFAMGVNMPARTVVFDSCRKHDGLTFRNLLPAEYIQMAGRAGRRGLDTTGTVIILCKQGIPDESDLKRMMLGDAAKLESQFRLTYSLLLNSLRAESLTVEEMMKRSFLEAGKLKKVEGVLKKKERVEERISEVEKLEKWDIGLVDYYKKVRDFVDLHYPLMERLVMESKIFDVNTRPGQVILFESLPLLSPRLGIFMYSRAIKDRNSVYKLLRILTLTSTTDTRFNYYKDLLAKGPNYGNGLVDDSSSESVARLFSQMMYYSFIGHVDFEPSINEMGYTDYSIIEIRCHNVLEVINYTISMDIPNTEKDYRERTSIYNRNNRQFQPPGVNLLRTLNEIYTLHMNDIGQFGFIDLYFSKNVMKDEELFHEVERYLDMKHDLKTRNLFFGPSKVSSIEEFVKIFQYMRLVDERQTLEFSLSPLSLQLYDEYRQRKDVLAKLSFIDSQSLVLLKGRVACEISGSNDLIMTELLLNNTFSDCSPEEIAALFSCMVFEAKRVPEPELADPEVQHLKEKVEEVKNVAKKIAEIQQECKLMEPVSQYVEQFKFGLVEVVYEWAKGKPFAEIMKLTEVQEGLIVRTIQRLDEIIRDVKDSARIIGDPSLKKKMEEASQCIKRDIVFAASLYTQE